MARLTAERWARVRPETSNENLNAGFADEKLYIAHAAPEELRTDLEESCVVLAVARTWPTT